MTNTISTFLIIFGGIVTLACHIWLVVRAFRISNGWGLLCMVFGWIGPLLLSFEHWKKIKVPLVVLYLGTAVLIFGVSMK